MVKPFLIGLATAAIPLLSAQAAPATSEEAARLTALFQRYIGQPAPGQPSGLTVTPEGESYRVTSDLQRLASGLASFGFTVEPSVSVTMLTPLPDGTWKVTAQNAPPLVMHTPQQTLTFKTGSSAFDGIYDPKIYGFLHSTTTYGGYDYAQTSPALTQSRHIDKLVFDLKGTPDSKGSVAVAGRYVGTGETSTIVIKVPGTAADPDVVDPTVPRTPAAETPIAYTSPGSTIDIGLGALRTKDLLDIWAFLVAHHDKASLTASQDEFKTRLRAILMPFDGLTENVAFDAFKVTTPLGPFSAKSMSGGIDAKGLTGTGTVSSRFAADGLTVPLDQLPPWSRDLVPSAISLDIGVDGFHASKAAAEAIRDFDLKAEPALTPEQGNAIGHLLWPGTGTVKMAPSRLTSKMLDLKMEGEASIGLVPTGHLTVTGTGLDKAISTIQAASAADPAAAQVLSSLVLAKNLAKPNADGSLTWLIEAKGDGPVTVNGAALQ